MPVNPIKLGELICAIKIKRDQAVKKLILEEKILEDGWDFDPCLNPLGVAAEVGNKFAIGLLINYIHPCSNAWVTSSYFCRHPIEIAARHGYWDCVKEIARHISIYREKDNNLGDLDFYQLGFVLDGAIRFGQISTMQVLLDAGAPRIYLNNMGHSYFYSAIFSNKELPRELVKKMIILLLTSGVGYFNKNKQKMTSDDVALLSDKRNVFNECIFKECLSVYLEQSKLFFVMIQSRSHPNAWLFEQNANILFYILSFLCDLHPATIAQFFIRQENVLTKISVNCFSRSFGLFNKHTSDSRKLLNDFNQHINDNVNMTNLDMTNKVKQSARLFANEQKEQNKVVKNLNKYHLLPRPGK